MAEWARQLSPPLLLLLGLLGGPAEAIIARYGVSAEEEVPDPYRSYDGLSLFRVSACSGDEVALAAGGLDNASCTFLSEPGQLALPPDGRCAEGLAVCAGDVRAAVPGAELLADGTAGRYFRERDAGVARPWPKGSVELGLGEQAFYEAFRSYDDIVERLRELVAHSRGAAKLVPLSKRTWEGREIHSVRLRGADWKPGMPRAVFTYLLHAREWITAMSGVYAVDRAIEMALADASFLAGLEVVFVPVSNPDGFVFSASRERYWRKNRRPFPGCDGVDLNRNFDFQWLNGFEPSPSRPQPPASLQCQEVYSGPTAASEPETKALQSLIREAPVAVSIDFHSCGGYILGPWSYTQEPHPRAAEIDELGGWLHMAIESVHGTDYHFCTGNRCLYPVPGNLADFGSSTGGLGFTVEMRPAVHGNVGMHNMAPPHDQILPNAEENFEAVLEAIAFARKSRG